MNTQIKNAVDKIVSLYQQAATKKWVYQVLVAASLLLLVGTAIYSTTKSAEFYSTNADALVDPYLFGFGAHRHTAVLPDQHANVLKFPIFFLEGELPYHYDTFMFFSILLVLIAVLGWAYVLFRLFGKRYLLLILVLFSALLFSSTELNINLGEISIRNIEFPIALWFVFIVNDVLRGVRYTRKTLSLAVLGCLLYCLTLAGDNLFEYAISAPVLLVLVWYWIQSKRFSKAMLNAALLVAGATVGALLIKLFVEKTGIAVIDTSAVFSTTIVTYANFWTSITSAFAQVLSMQGGSIFGVTLALRTLTYFVNFGLTFVAIVGSFLLLRLANRNFRASKNLTKDNGFILTVVAVSIFFVFWEYVLSGQVVQTLSNGQVVGLGQERYVSFIPFLLIICFIWVIKTYYSQHRVLIALLLIGSLVDMVTVIPSVRADYAGMIADVQPSRGVLNSIITDLHQDKVTDIMSNYWYSTPLRFWSHNTIQSGTVINCNQPFFFNVNETWYKPTGATRTALVIDRPDPSFWDCTNAQLTAIYGTPSIVQVVKGQSPGSYIYIWTYNYDVRTKLLPFATS